VIQEGNPRVPSGPPTRVWKCLIPSYGPNGILLCPQKSILDIRGKGKVTPKGCFSHVTRTSLLRKMFSCDLGMPIGISEVLSSRSIKELIHIEQIWQSIIDCFILAGPENLELYRPELRDMCRAHFSVGATNPDLLIKWWKEVQNRFYLQACTMVTRKDQKISPNNFFWTILQKCNFFQSYHKKGKIPFERLLSFTSSRGLPAKQDLKESLDNFKSLVSEEYKTPTDIINGLAYQARRIGHLSDRTIKTAYWHFSANQAGSLFASVKDGGKAKEMMDEIRPLLMSLPSDDSEEKTPFGVLREKKGVPRWKTWFRHPDFHIDNPEDGFMEAEKYLVFPTLPFSSRVGLDADFATQIFYIAYCNVKEHLESGLPLPVRVEPIPETGGKVRTISMGPWWSQVYQAPFGHSFQEYLKGDYDGQPCLYRASPSWDAFISLSEVLHRKNKDVFLFSDMTSCTDAFPKDLASSMMYSFCEGLNIKSDLVSMAIDLAVGQRLCLCSDGTTVLAKRSVLMGEPMTKSFLTLYMSAMRAETLRRFLGYYPNPLPNWYLFHIGGDDHLVHGPVDYINQVMDYIERSGFIIDHSKQGYSTYGGKYLQVPFYLHNVDFKNWTAVFNKETYEKTVYCDNIKAKLLCPHTKAHEARNELNVAVGKALALGKAFQYYPTDNYKRSIRDRFLWRMNRLLPSQHTEVKLFRVSLLPQILGGLGLAISDEEVISVLPKLPLIHQVFLTRLKQGVASIWELRVLSRFNQNIRYFDDSDEHDLISLIVSQLPRVDQVLPKGKKFTHFVEELQIDGIYTIENLISRVQRLRKSSLDIQNVPEPKDVPWTKKYWNIWKIYESVIDIHIEIDLPTSVEEIRSQIDSLNMRQFIDTKIDEVCVFQSGSEELGLFADFMTMIEFLYPAMSVSIPLGKYR